MNICLFLSSNRLQVSAFHKTAATLQNYASIHLIWMCHRYNTRSALDEDRAVVFKVGGTAPFGRKQSLEPLTSFWAIREVKEA